MCNATNDDDALDDMVIIWLRKISEDVERDVKSDKRILIYNKTDSSVGKVHSVLLFDPVNHNDDGEYICRALNHPQSFSKELTKLNVKCKVELCMHASIVLYDSNMIMNHIKGNFGGGKLQRKWWLNTNLTGQLLKIAFIAIKAGLKFSKVYLICQKQFSLLFTKVFFCQYFLLYGYSTFTITALFLYCITAFIR